MMMYHQGWGMMVGMMLFWLVALGVGIWLLARLFPDSASRGAPPAGQADDRRDPALDVVRQRYARGEITRAEYEELVRTLS